MPVKKEYLCKAKRKIFRVVNKTVMGILCTQQSIYYILYSIFYAISVPSGEIRGYVMVPLCVFGGELGSLCIGLCV